MRKQAIVLTIVLVVHHAIAVMHGGAHADIPVTLSSAQNVFVYLVILLLPIVAVVMLWTKFARPGLLLLLVSMVGSLTFDIYHHYILVSPDNISHLPESAAGLQDQFVWTAHGLTLTQAVLVGLAVYFLRSSSSRPD